MSFFNYNLSVVSINARASERQDGKEHVIPHASRSLHPTERNDKNYSSFKLELLALKWAITEKFKDYLTGAEFVAFTDNNPVVNLQNARLGTAEQRWVAQLAAFDFEVKYRAGKENADADALSRFPADCQAAHMTTKIAPPGDLQEPLPQMGDWKGVQEQDVGLQMLRSYMEQGTLPDVQKRNSLLRPVQKWLCQWRRLRLREGVLYREVMDSKT